MPWINSYSEINDSKIIHLVSTHNIVKSIHSQLHEETGHLVSYSYISPSLFPTPNHIFINSTCLRILPDNLLIHLYFSLHFFLQFSSTLNSPIFFTTSSLFFLSTRSNHLNPFTLIFSVMFVSHKLPKFLIIFNLIMLHVHLSILISVAFFLLPLFYSMANIQIHTRCRSRRNFIKLSSRRLWYFFYPFVPLRCKTNENDNSWQ